MAKLSKSTKATVAVALSTGIVSLGAVGGGYLVSEPATALFPGSFFPGSLFPGSADAVAEPLPVEPDYPAQTIGIVAPHPVLALTGVVEKLANFAGVDPTTIVTSIEFGSDLRPANNDPNQQLELIEPFEVSNIDEILEAFDDITPEQLPDEVAVALDTLLAAQSAQPFQTSDNPNEQSVLALAAPEITPVQVFYDLPPEVLSLEAAVTQWGESLVVFNNGEIPLEAMCALEFEAQHQLRCDAAYMLQLLNEAFAAEFGHNLPIVSSYRTIESQYELAITKPNLSATPGTSNHGWGIAIDFGTPINEYESDKHIWLRLNAPDFGWDNPLWARGDGSRPEPWHWEFFALNPMPPRALVPADVSPRLAPRWVPEPVAPENTEPPQPQPQPAATDAAQAVAAAPLTEPSQSTEPAVPAEPATEG